MDSEPDPQEESPNAQQPSEQRAEAQPAEEPDPGVNTLAHAHMYEYQLSCAVSPVSPPVVTASYHYCCQEGKDSVKKVFSVHPKSENYYNHRKNVFIGP